MIQRIIDQPWVFLGFVTVIVLLNVGAAIRIRHDRNLKRRAAADRRKSARRGGDRRWRPRH